MSNESESIWTFPPKRERERVHCIKLLALCGELNIPVSLIVFLSVKQLYKKLNEPPKVVNKAMLNSSTDRILLQESIFFS